MAQIPIVLFAIFLISWLMPRVAWTYRFHDIFSVLLMAVFALVFAAPVAILGSIAIEAGDWSGSDSWILTDSEDENVLRNTLYGLAFGILVSLLSGILYAKRLKKGGLRFGEKFDHYFLWSLGYLISRTGRFLGRMQRGNREK